MTKTIILLIFIICMSLKPFTKNCQSKVIMKCYKNGKLIHWEAGDAIQYKNHLPLIGADGKKYAPDEIIYEAIN